MELTYENYLAHYGVKGMKWGVRRRRDVTDSNSKSSNRRINREKVKKAAAIGLGAAGTLAVGAIAYKARSNHVQGKLMANRLMAEKVAKMSVFELAVHLDSKPKLDKGDEKVYGAKGAKRVADRIRKGSKPSDSRKIETSRQIAEFIVRSALNEKRLR